MLYPNEHAASGTAPQCFKSCFLFVSHKLHFAALLAVHLNLTTVPKMSPIGLGNETSRAMIGAARIQQFKRGRQRGGRLTSCKQQREVLRT